MLPPFNRRNKNTVLSHQLFLLNATDFFVGDEESALKQINLKTLNKAKPD